MDGMNGDPSRFKIPPGEGEDFLGAPCHPRSPTGEGATGGDFKIHYVQEVLADLQVTEDWKNQRWAASLQPWVKGLIRELDIRVKSGQLLEPPPLKIQKMNVKTIGTFQPERDGFAIPSTIILNEEWLASQEDFVILAHLAKLLFCARAYHAKEGTGRFDKGCRERLGAAGIVIWEDGSIHVDPLSKFGQTMIRHGFAATEPERPALPPRKAKSTNKLWTCGCQRARIGKKEFRARCLDCHKVFEIVEDPT